MMQPRLSSLTTNLRRFARGVQGIATIEFAIAVNVLVIMLIGSIDITQYALTLQKAEKTVNAVNDMVSQLGPYLNPSHIQKTTLTGILNNGMPSLLAPYTVTGTNSSITLSDVNQNPAGPPKVNWHFCSGSNTNCQTTIQVVNGGISVGGSQLAMSSGDEVIIVELFMQYTPPINANFIFGNSNHSISIYKYLISIPRNPPLTVPPG